MNSNANGTSSFLDGVTGSLNSVADTFAGFYGAKAAYEGAKAQNRQQAAQMEQYGMFGTVQRENQVNGVGVDITGRRMQSQPQGPDWQKYAMIGGAVVVGLILLKKFL